MKIKKIELAEIFISDIRTIILSARESAIRSANLYPYKRYKYSRTHQTSTADQYSYQPVYNSGNDWIGYSITNLCHVLSCQYNMPRG